MCNELNNNLILPLSPKFRRRRKKKKKKKKKKEDVWKKEEEIEEQKKTVTVSQTIFRNLLIG
jgi:hypothetical protein